MEAGLRERRRRIPTSLVLPSSSTSDPTIADDDDQQLDITQQLQQITTPLAARIVSPRMFTIEPTALPVPLTSFLTTTLYQTTTTVTEKVTSFPPRVTSIPAHSGSSGGGVFAGAPSSGTPGAGGLPSLGTGTGAGSGSSLSNRTSAVGLRPTSGAAASGVPAQPAGSEQAGVGTTDTIAPRTGAMLLAGVSSAAGVSLIGITAFFIAKRRNRPNNRNSLDAARARAIAGELERPYSSRYRL